VDGFDVDAAAAQLATWGVPYCILTLGQNSGHYCSPNATYDSIVGIRPSKCSRRDLVADFAAALRRHNIRLIAYLPSGAPAADPVAVQAFGWEWGYNVPWPNGWAPEYRDCKRLADFQQKWEAVIREWSLRWATHVAGWWIDGCYFAEEMYRHADAPNFASFAAALKAGNPAAIVAFNPGVFAPVICHSEVEDFTAGEISVNFPLCPGRWVARNGHQAQWHVLSWIGDQPGVGQPRLPVEFVIGYTRHANHHGGVITWDVPTDAHGLIQPPFTDILTQLARATR
jgi:hypothetical protein